MSEIIPAIIPRATEDIYREVEKIKSEASTLHIDVLPETFEPGGVEVGMDFEVHFMFPDSHKYIDGWLNAGAKRVLVHLEDFANAETLSQKVLNIRSRSEAGLAVKLDTDLELVYPHMQEADFIQLMSIAQIGEQGHPFDERIFDRIKAVKGKFPSTVISVDGGINAEHAKQLLKAGADRLVVGHSFKEVWSQTNK